VSVKDPNGNFLANGNDGDDKGPYLAPVSGTYTVTLAGFNASQSGDYHFQVPELDRRRDADCLGDTQTGTDRYAAGRDRLQIHGQPGQVIFYDALKSDNINATARLIGPDAGQLTIVNIDQDGQGVVSLGGTHYVLLSSNVNAAANYKFRLSDENAAPVIAIGSVVSGNLDTGRNVAVYTFTAAQGQRLIYDGLDNDFDGP